MKRLALVLACLLVSQPAQADADDAAAWKRRGDEAMESGRAAEALAAYRRAREIAPAPALDYNIGRALLAVGDFVGALEAFERYDATAPQELKERTHRLAEIMAELRAKIATLTVLGDLAGARVEIRDQLAAAPHVPMRLNPGPAAIRVTREGSEPFLANIDLAPGRAHVVTAVLRSERAIAVLSIGTRPARAAVEVDGLARGAAPVDLELAPGVHDVAVSAPSFDRRRMTVTLARSESRRIDVELVPEPKPLTSRWWFWTGVGVVVAGAGVGIAAATLERSPKDGSLGTFSVP